MSLVVKGRLADLIYARFDPGEDLLSGIQSICKDHGIQTGVVISITGALVKARLQRYPEKEIPGGSSGEVVDIPGPLEATGAGIIGETYAPSLGQKPFNTTGRYVHGEPYVHIHLVVTSARETVCGHLMEGCPVRSRNPNFTHFTIVIARTEGVQLRMVTDEKGFGRPYHDLSIV